MSSHEDLVSFLTMNSWNGIPPNRSAPESQFPSPWHQRQGNAHQVEAATSTGAAPISRLLQVQDAEPPSSSAQRTRGPQGKRRQYDNLDWEAHQSDLRKLYLIDNKTLAETMKIMEERHAFVASAKLYKLQFKKWDWQKNLPATHSRFMVEMAHKRKREENKDTIFEFGGQQWDHDKYTSLVRGSKAQRLEQVQDYSTPTGVSYMTPKYNAPTPAQDPVDSGESGTESDVDMSDEEANDVPDYIQDVPDDSSDVEVYRAAVGQRDGHDDVGIPLLNSQGLAQSQLLILCQAAQSYKREGKLMEAEEAYLKASEGLSETMGLTNLETNRVKYELANFYAESRRMQDADAILDNMTRDHVEYWGHAHERTRKHVLHAVELLETWNRSSDALGLLSHSKEIIERLDHRGHRGAPRSRRLNQTRRAPESRRIGQGSDLQAIADDITEAGSLATVNYGIGVAKSHVTANDEASQGLLQAIIRHCERHPQGRALQHVQAIAEILSLYTRLGKASVHEPDFFAAEETLRTIWSDYDWDKERFQSIEVMEASMQLALNIFRGGFRQIATRIFRRVDDKARSLFGIDDERTIWILITIGLAYQSNATWVEAEEWFEAAFAAALSSNRWDEEDGIVRSLQNALDKRHFSYLSDEGRPYKTIFGISGISIRPGRLHLS
ncbi:hypothetical protein CPLU01_04956 [Colletotrichum plurivorum]|uniref:Clr5 domain-containing protein n=1 Tax=Colletotrichum plurivorum TaxID=2175906 RepID=A0A8H6KPC7_9PEZI|nr:hypothetical protein CPLU01_04956 [Colletotrichum plurivorum]